MPNATSRLQIQIDAKNNASPAIKSVSNDLAGLDKGAATASKGFAGLAIAGGVTAVAALGAAAVGAAVDLGRVGAQSMDVAKSFDTMASSAGEASSEMMAGLKEASRGAISDFELMLTANRSMLLGVSDNTEQMVALMDVARARSQALGVTTAQAFSDIVTGIGRMSPLILDNLGIVIDQAAANEAYAASIGSTVAKLTEQEKKQALVNAVLKDSADLVAANEAAGDDMASKFERMDAALANAKAALGELFSPAVAAIAEMLANAVTEVTASLDEMGEAGNLADMKAAAESASIVIAGLELNLADLIAEEERLAAANQKGTESYRNIRDGIESTEAALAEAKGATIAYNRAALEASASLSELDHAQMEADLSMRSLTAATPGAAAGLGQVGMSADALSERLAQLKSQSDATRAALAGITSAAVGALHSAASAAVGIMPTTEITRIYSQSAKALEGQRKAMEAVGMTTDEIDFKMQELAKKASAPFDIAVEAAREAEKANKATAGSVEKLSEEYTNLHSKVTSVLSGALNTGVGVDPDDVLEAMGFPREDEINENARRLADIAKNGLKGQEWLDEFQNEVPDIWKMIRLAQNPQEEAARLLRDFQDGLLTSPIDKEKAKEIVRRQIMGDQNMAALANEIATELATEMGIPLQQALAATSGALGTGSGAGGQAATTFSEAAEAGLDESGGGSAFVSKFTDQMRASYSLLQTAGKDAGKQWGDAFIAVVGDNVPPSLISLLTDLVTPQVAAKFAQQGTLQGTARIMALATVPTLGGVALPAPKEQNYTRLYRGGTLTMANGKIVHDLIDNNARHSFSLRWEFITNAQLGTITTAWDGIKNAGAAYVSVRNTSHTVTRPEGGELDVTPVVSGGGDLKFHVTMELIEDS